ncbi:MAG: glycosyltransferase family 39 protein [Bacteroidia bacterium]
MPKLLLYGLIGWLILNLLQAALTELLHDEAYYWIFSRRLSIVYFDQMPGVAYFIRAGSSIFPGEFGVRFLSVLLAPLTLLIYYRLTGVSDPKWFLAIAFSMVSIHFNGFFTSPDSVLSFTLALFLLAYKHFSDSPGWKEALLLTLAAGIVGYSKYQGVLFILVLALMQPRLMRRPAFWLVPIGFALLILPIYLTDPQTVEATLRFQLFERGTSELSILKPLDFLSSQLVILGPIATPLVVWAWIRYRPKDAFMRSIHRASFVYFGILVLLSLRTKVEANWSAPILGCLIMFAVNYYAGLKGAWKWIRLVFVVSFIGILGLRAYLIWDFLPASLSHKMRPETHGWKEWAQEVKSVCKDEPIVFWNTYQLPSKFWYYTGTPTTCISNSSYRRNQFSLLPIERELQGKSVWLAAGFPHSTGGNIIPTPDGHKVYLIRVPRFYTYSEIRITADLPDRFIAGDSIDLPIHLHNEAPSGKLFLAPDDNRVTVGYSWIGDQHEGLWGEHPTDLRGQSADIDRDMVIRIAVPTEPGKYALSIHILSNLYQFSYNSDRIPVRVEAK